MNIVLDTNVLVSALWSPGRKPWEIVNAVLTRRFRLCYDMRIVGEYERVLRYPKFQFQEWEVRALLDPMVRAGLPVSAPTLKDVPFTDESDRKFYEVARHCNAPLVTGNLAHFPQDETVISVAEFHRRYMT